MLCFIREIFLEYLFFLYLDVFRSFVFFFFCVFILFFYYIVFVDFDYNILECIFGNEKYFIIFRNLEIGNMFRVEM